MADTKVTTLRLEVNVAKELAVIARADGEPVSELVRAALNRYIAYRFADKRLQQRCDQLLEEDAALVGRMRERSSQNP